MDLVKQIMSQLSGEALKKLGDSLGSDNETTEQAASAAVPSLLAALTGLASQAGGAQKLTSALGGLDTSTLGNFAHLLSGDSSALSQKGGSLLSSLFGESLLSTLASAISRFSGLNVGAAKSLLATLAPMVLGHVASQWKNRGGSTSALTSMLTEQKGNIADAIPAGFTMPEVPGLGQLGDTVRAGGRAAERASRSVASWAVPLALLVVSALLVWNFMPKNRVSEPTAMKPTASQPETTTVMKPVVSDAQAAASEVTQLSTELGDTFKSATETFAGIKDAASAQAAMPQLQELKQKLSMASESLGKLSVMSRTSIHQLVEQRWNALQERINTIGSIPGISAEFKQLMNEIVNQIKELSGAQPATHQ
jgi:hypothetical protein